MDNLQQHLDENSDQYDFERYLDDNAGELYMECLDCDWSGFWTELEIGDNYAFELCPECQSDNVEMV